MSGYSVPKATLGRLPIYLRYLKTIEPERKNISATNIARALGYGEVQVRKDLGAVSGEGKPKVGYVTNELIESLERYLGKNRECQTVIVGAGKLGRALLDYGGFADFGLDIVAAFDIAVTKKELSDSGKPIYPMQEFENFCDFYGIKVGIITVPAQAAQGVCDLMVDSRISAIWSFAPEDLVVPEGVTVQKENLALSLAHLTKQI